MITGENMTILNLFNNGGEMMCWDSPYGCDYVLAGLKDQCTALQVECLEKDYVLEKRE